MERKVSLINQVTAVIEEIGAGTADDVLEELGEDCGYTRAQILAALKNAKNTKRLVNDGAHGGAKMVVYRPAPRPPGPRPPCSVWEYAQRIGAATVRYEIPVFTRERA
jgi:hypothetical protein